MLVSPRYSPGARSAFWDFVREGLSISYAAVAAGVSQRTGAMRFGKAGRGPSMCSSCHGPTALEGSAPGLVDINL